MRQFHILIADDHMLVRRGLADLLSAERDFMIVGEAANGREACEQTKLLKPDLVIMDLSMPIMSGVEAVQVILQLSPETKVLVLTTFGTSVDVNRALEAGAAGALVKDTDENELIEAIRAVLRGETVLSPAIRAMLATEPRPPELTDRQQKVLELTVRGLTSEDIAIRLGISPNAVDQHLNAIRSKLGANNKTEAVAIALRKQLLKI